MENKTNIEDIKKYLLENAEELILKIARYENIDLKGREKILVQSLWQLSDRELYLPMIESSNVLVQEYLNLFS